MNMLTRIILYNSGVFDKADLELNKNSLQLLGPNNIGKSTLAYTLNFLYLPGLKKRRFSGGRDERESYRFYFPELLKSHMVFESRKTRYWFYWFFREYTPKPVVYRVAHHFDPTLFEETIGDQTRIRGAKEILQLFQEKGVEFKKLETDEDLARAIFSREKEDGAVTWLTQKCGSPGRNNPFQKIYQYLVNASSIQAESLKISLMIADGRAETSVEFKKEKQDHLFQLEKILEEIQKIRRFEKNFEELERRWISLKSLKSTLFQTLGELAGIRKKNHQQFLEKERIFKDNLERLKSEQATLLIEKEVINPILDQTLKQTGGFDLEIQEVGKKLQSITRLDSEAILKTSLVNINSSLEEVIIRSREVARVDQNRNSFEKDLKLKVEEKKTLEGQIRTFEKSFLKELGGDEKHLPVLNTLLSEQVKALTRDRVKKGVKFSGCLVTLFDGEFDISGLNLQPPPPLSELKERGEFLAKQIDMLKETQINLENYQKLREEKNRLELELKNVEKALALRIQENDFKKEKARLELENEKAIQKIQELKGKLNQLEIQQNRVREESQKTENELGLSRVKQRELEIRITSNLERWNGADPELEDTLRDAEFLLEKTEKLFKELEKSGSYFQSEFERLKMEWGSSESDPENFIENARMGIQALPDKETSVHSLLEQVAQQFSEPSARILNEFRDFKKFIEKFNRNLRKRKISDLQEVTLEIDPGSEIIQMLEKVSSIRDFGELTLFSQGTQREELNTLRDLLGQNRIIHFQDLFSLKVKILTREGKTKEVKIDKQIESDGTDRVVKLILFLNIIETLRDSSKENRLAFYLDEIATLDPVNLKAILDYCRENFFYPIFAAPVPVDGPDFFYPLHPMQGGKIRLTGLNRVDDEN